MTKTESRRKNTAAQAFDYLPEQIRNAALGAQDKKALDLTVLDVRDVSSFTDYFLISTGQNVRQVQAIADAVEESLRKAGARPAHVEGYERGDWVLLDYFDFVVHVFAPETRMFYGLERLWGNADRIEVPAASALPPRG